MAAFTFEANPHAFAFFRRSAYANKLVHNSRIALVNALVGDAPGKGKLNFNPEELAGATKTDTEQWGSKRQSIEMPVVTIDDILPLHHARRRATLHICSIERVII